MDGTRSPRQPTACWAVFPQSETPEYTCLSRKPVALMNWQVGACVITPLAAYCDDATQSILTPPGSVQLLAVGLATASDNPWRTPGVNTSDDSSRSIRSGAASKVAHPGRSRGPGMHGGCFPSAVRRFCHGLRGAITTSSIPTRHPLPKRGAVDVAPISGDTAAPHATERPPRPAVRSTRWWDVR